MAQVALIVLDGMPTRHVTPEVTPHLWSLALEAGQVPGTATGVMPAATYPNHATFVTGRHPVDHGIVANWFFADGQPVPAESVGPEGPTLFDACRAAGRSSAVVVGDQHLVGVLAADRADEHWPDGGQVPDGAPLDAMGYLADAYLVPRLAGALADGHDLLVAQVNGPDTIGHTLGPDDGAALDGYRDVDALVPSLREALAPRWHDTVAVVVSDHTMEPLTHPEPLDAFALAREHGMLGLPEGGSALFEGTDEPSWLAGVDGCDGYERLSPSGPVERETAGPSGPVERETAGPSGPVERETAGPELWMAWTEPGWWFAVEGLDLGYRGMHGNPTTLEQLALVTGGHPAAAALAERVHAGSATALDWAPTLAGLLGVTLDGVAGRDLLAPPRLR